MGHPEVTSASENGRCGDTGRLAAYPCIRGRGHEGDHRNALNATWQQEEPEQQPEAPRTFAWCAWHKEFSGTARLVRVIEQGSGPGHGMFACADCRKRFGLVPLADQ